MTWGPIIHCDEERRRQTTERIDALAKRAPIRGPVLIGPSTLRKEEFELPSIRVLMGASGHEGANGADTSTGDHDGGAGRGPTGKFRWIPQGGGPDGRGSTES